MLQVQLVLDNICIICLWMQAQLFLSYNVIFIYFVIHCLMLTTLFSYTDTYCITKTCLYNFDPLEPHFYIVKLGFAGVQVIFLISDQNMDCGYSLEPPRPQFSFEQKYEKYHSFFYLQILKFLEENCLYIWIGVFS